MSSPVQLILYSKPGCHLCEGLQEKLEGITSMNLLIDIRDITTRTDWFQQFQYEIPVLFYVANASDASPKTDSSNQVDPQAMNQSLGESSSAFLVPVERPSPRASIDRVEKLVRRAIAKTE